MRHPLRLDFAGVCRTARAAALGETVALGARGAGGVWESARPTGPAGSLLCHRSSTWLPREPPTPLRHAPRGTGAADKVTACNTVRPDGVVTETGQVLAVWSGERD